MTVKDMNPGIERLRGTVLRRNDRTDPVWRAHEHRSQDLHSGDLSDTQKVNLDIVCKRAAG